MISIMNKKINDIFTFLRSIRGLETTPRYSSTLKEDARNTVAEHSWHLAMMVMLVATEFNVKIDIQKAVAMALLHDIAEATTGDFDAYAQIALGSSFVEKKSKVEETVVAKMTQNIGFGERIFKLWDEFEKQETNEAKFVKALDKLEGFLHISEVGIQAYTQKEFHIDYADKAFKAFAETEAHFPELSEMLVAVKEDIKTQCKKAGIDIVS